MANNIDFWTLLKLTQEYVSQHYAAVLTDKSKLNQLKAYVDKYLRDNDYHVENLTTKELIDRLYREMAEYSVLTPFLGSPELEEININGWDDIALTYLDGSIVKMKDHFHSPGHAVDIIKRLLHHSGMIIDNATPTAQGHLPGNTRITALKDPIVDEERGVSVSIRLLHPSRVTRENLNDMSGYTGEQLSEIFRKNIDLEFKSKLNANRNRNKIAVGLVGIGVTFFIAMMLISRLWATDSVWKEIFIYISDIATTVTFWEAMTILVVEQKEKRAYLRNLKHRFSAIAFEKASSV